jgi:hypothetical protein
MKIENQQQCLNGVFGYLHQKIILENGEFLTFGNYLMDHCGLVLEYYLYPDDLGLDLFSSEPFAEEIQINEDYCRLYGKEFKVDYFDILKVPHSLFPTSKNISILGQSFYNITTDRNLEESGKIGSDKIYRSEFISN